MRWRSFVVAVFLSACMTAQRSPQSLLDRLDGIAAAGTLVVAHRGSSSDAPENTVVAMRRAVDAGAQLVEFDVWQTADGAWVCLHDETLDRTTDAAKRLGKKGTKVGELRLAQLRELDAGSWKGAEFVGERMPTLAEALAAIGDAVPMIERKGGDAAALVEELRRLKRIDDVLVQAFDWDWLEQVHRHEPRLVLGALGGKTPTRELLADLPRTGAKFVHWSHTTLDLATVAALREQRYRLCVYTIDADLHLLGAAALGCDWLTTNVPARAVALRRLGRLARGG
ncbi:MAG: Glycerophosphoryl diester phosphodiesterase [Planctomycetota bacterium]|jgi:glycerophosphoryl diester phosphodiesterase